LSGDSLVDSPSNNLDRWKEIANDRRTKSLVIAVLILVVIVVMQIGNLKKNTPMCELLTDCNLRNIDLHRMQIALSKSGLVESKIDGNRLLVPEINHAKYLQAVVEQNAMPPELRTDENESASTNWLLSRSQQISLQLEARKKHVQEMVIRLPFVESAWFEMDEPENHSSFSQVQKSAVISIRPLEHRPLLDQHVETVRQMITGAVNGIDPQQIVVIDLSSGFAYCNDGNDCPADRQIQAHRIAFARQQLLETRLREALIHYPGLRITVVVEPSESDDQLADRASEFSAENLAARNIDTTRETSGQPGVRAGAPTNATAFASPTAHAGANEQASISDFSHQPDTDVQLVNYRPESAPARQQVSVLIDVPYELVAQLYGETEKPVSFTSQSIGIENTQRAAQSEEHFADLKTEIERIVRPFLASGPDSTALPITFNLLRPAMLPANPWVSKIQTYAQENWPSLAVLLIGLVLISLVTQSGRSVEPASAGVAHARSKIDGEDPNADILSLQSESMGASSDDSPDDSKRDAKRRLSELIEQDPDAAAKVIENWIRDAA
jgi:flagellar biosynthesis/type III secretory pathway M-ring protein FliF/YscJ